MEEAILLDFVETVHPVDRVEPGLCARNLRDRNGAVERHDRGWNHAIQEVVKRDDLSPVSCIAACGATVYGADRGLQLEGSGPAHAKRRFQFRRTLFDRWAMPSIAVLLAQGDDLSVRPDPGRPPGVIEHHQRQQTTHFRLFGHQAAKDSREPNRLDREIRTIGRLAPGRQKPLIRNQVEHVQHGIEPFGQIRQRRRLKRNTRIAYLPLRTRDPLRDGRFFLEERGGNFGGGQSP